MPKPSPTGVRFAPHVSAMIEDLSIWWGPVEQLSLAAVVHEAVRRAHDAEEKERKKSQKKIRETA